MTRYVTDDPSEVAGFSIQWQLVAGEEDPEQRFRLYRLCECETCGGHGKHQQGKPLPPLWVRCKECRGEGRVRELIATAGSPEAVGVALVTLAREGEFEECPIGLLDTQGEPGQKWLVRPWLPSARNLTDAGRALGKQSARKRGASAS